MEANQRPEDVKPAQYQALPPECSFTMQQWLYRRTPHTRRYKRCYIVLHKDRLYSFRKPPSFHGCEPGNLMASLRYATASWMIAGAEIKADPQQIGGFYKWKLVVKPMSQYVGDNNTVFNAVLNKVPNDDTVASSCGDIDDIFREINAANHVSNAFLSPYTEERTVWLATSNHKVATDWLLAMLWTARYGSLQNFVYQNLVRSKYLSFALPTYLMAFDYFPSSANRETTPKRTAAFTFMKLNVIELLHMPMLEKDNVCCIVEHNSSFYILNLPQASQGDRTEVPKALSNLSYIEEETNECRFDDEHMHVLKERKYGKLGDMIQSTSTTREASQGKHIAKKISDLLGKHDTLIDTELVDDDRTRIKPNPLAPGTPNPHAQGYNVLSKLWNLNKPSEKRKHVIVKRSTYYGDDAYIYIPLYKNASQDMVWLHFVTTSHIYIGSASLSNSDFSITEPAKVKTCALTNIEAINPLNYKRLDISDHPQQTSVIKTSLVNQPIPEAGMVVISVVTPKHLGNFMDPVTLAYHSSQEYLSKATKASTAGGLHMLTSNIRRGVAAYRTTKTLRRYVKGVLQFKNPKTSVFWMVYITLALGVYPDKLLLFAIMPLIYYSVSSHPNIGEWFINLLLKYPILIAILPRKVIQNFLLLPKPACMACAKRKAFLLKNSHKVRGDVSKQSIAVQMIQVPDKRGRSRQSLRSFEASGEKEQVVQIETSDTPMLTSRHAMNAYVSYNAYSGTHVERCKHRGVIQAYLASLFLDHVKGSNVFSKLKSTDSRRMIRAFHRIFYVPPPYPCGVLPWMQNVILTVKYYMMTALLTFTGGIANVQILHLLHRKRVSKRLVVEAVDTEPTETECELQQSPRMESSAAPEYIVTEWYENERKSIFGVYSKENLRFYDRPHLTAENGRAVDVPGIMICKSTVAVTKDTDENGWVYSKNWNSVWVKESSAFTFVRRRKWVIVHRNTQRDLLVRNMIQTRRTDENSFMTAKSLSTRFSYSMQQPGSPVPNGCPLASRKPPSTAHNLAKLSYHGGTYSNASKPESSGAGGKRIVDAVADPMTKKILAMTSDDIERRHTHSDGSSDIPVKHGGTPITQSRLTVREMLKKGLTILKKEVHDPTPTAPSPATKVTTSLRETNEDAHVFGILRWRRFRHREQAAAIDERRDASIESNLFIPEAREAFVEYAEEIKPVGTMQPKICIEAEEDDDWLTDNEEAEEMQTKNHTLLNNIVAFALVIPFCLLLDLFKVIFRMIWTVLSIAFWILGLSQDEAECEMVSHEEQCVVAIKRLKRCCFMGKARIRIYNAAKGRRSRLHGFVRPVKHRRTNYMVLYNRNYRLMHIDRDPEDDYYETFSVPSDFEEHTDSKVCGATAQESDESESELQSSESNGAMGLHMPIEADTMDVEPNALWLQHADSAESGIERHPPQKIVPPESHQRRRRIYSYIKNIYERNVKKQQPEDGDFADLTVEGTKQSSDYERVDSNDDMKTEHKLSVLGMLRKAKDQIVWANYYINLLTMRYEKFLNMFVWRHDTITKMLLVMFVALGLMNYLVGANILLLIYILLYFKSGYASRMWEQNILHTVKRHLDGCLADMEIYRPFWDLTNKQVAQLATAIKRFCQVEVSSTMIRESQNRWDLARAITTEIIEQNMCRGWEHRSCFVNIFRQSPNLLEC
ncbi:hypothetical protein X943_003103 [Babesia divergens]|uniref:PH domain-containing protein n=1 Tax=Babesia divergens TaxID=32595 RepID=A0AAD9LJK8_BABDI|nr:hypothetical protein X943_003103 [Babesia divergens]